MKVSFGILATLLGASSYVASAAPTDQSSARDLILSLNEKATSALENAETEPRKRSAGPKKCTIFNAAVRRDW